MEKIIVNQISQERYIKIITVLDYEIRLHDCLAELMFPPTEKKVIVDLALKSGINQYRFVEFGINDNGKLILDSNQYVLPTDAVQRIANRVLQEKREIVLNSILPESQKVQIINMHTRA